MLKYSLAKQEGALLVVALIIMFLLSAAGMSAFYFSQTSEKATAYNYYKTITEQNTLSEVYEQKYWLADDDITMQRVKKFIPSFDVKQVDGINFVKIKGVVLDESLCEDSGGGHINCFQNYLRYEKKVPALNTGNQINVGDGSSDSYHMFSLRVSGFLASNTNPDKVDIYGEEEQQAGFVIKRLD
ncbi:hypothetical protein [Zooshikella harenae]|uniref:Type 4 fimbrial biogenesis protein PilX N-terminal domain-containing protein n=1 Tax=Zooshikella harenae TaxID=2827238 RepID=A0ABS5Z7X7_9GAMM|nr:hypothetical protein [Zooshikella harenae]MBU2710152.1 hypothetical protein [Zooshikella harenae]